MCSLKSLADDTITQCQVELVKRNEYRIQHVPTVRERHELMVSVNGQEVAGSPFPVFVSIDPTLLGKPVGVITGVKNPWNVAVSATGNSIVTEYSGNTMLFKKNGRKLRHLNFSRIGVGNPCGVAVDNTDGSMYISGWGKKIIKLNPDFTLAGEFTGHGEAHYRCIAVVREEVMVTERSKNVVMVYTKNLKPVRQFGSHGDGPGQFMNIVGLSSGENGNLYVSDFDRGCVHVFSNGGKFLHSFGLGGDCAKLISPFGVCVVGQYVYVACSNGHCVSVFTTDGQYVTSFGKFGSGKSGFSGPRGVYVDIDGYVYVCDKENDRVKIF